MVGEDHEISISPFFSICTFHILTEWISELSIKTHACLSSLSCRLIDCWHSAQALLDCYQADLQPHVKEETETEEEGFCPHFGIYVCLDWTTLLTAAQTLIWHWQSRLTSDYWMNTRYAPASELQRLVDRRKRNDSHFVNRLIISVIFQAKVKHLLIPVS